MKRAPPRLEHKLLEPEEMPSQIFSQNATTRFVEIGQSLSQSLALDARIGHVAQRRRWPRARIANRLRHRQAGAAAA
ncbi:hypothetical protein AWV80_04090 [Cupriavidus sp. UYMU48A]|nr:hypothetical protein AWV80_04090 [Cupriavidus sp. UYMU48A]